MTLVVEEAATARSRYKITREMQVHHANPSRCGFVLFSQGRCHTVANNVCCMCHTHRFCGKILEERDLEPVMTKMREQLMSRNVASEVANDITASVQATLLDQKLKSFTRCAHRRMGLCPR